MLRDIQPNTNQKASHPPSEINLRRDAKSMNNLKMLTLTASQDRII